MKTILLCFSLFFYCFCFSQKDTQTSQKITFSQLELAIPFKGNPNRNNTEINEQSNKNWFIPDGIFTKVGYGIHYNSWIGISLNTGIDWKATEKMIAVPIYTNLRIAPKISQNSRITLQTAYGRGFVLGRGNVSGEYKKISLGFETDSECVFFIELSEYDVQFNNFNKINSVSLGVAALIF